MFAEKGELCLHLVVTQGCGYVVFVSDKRA